MRTLFMLFVERATWHEPGRTHGTFESQAWARQEASRILDAMGAGDTLMIPRDFSGPHAWVRTCAVRRKLRLVEFADNGERYTDDRRDGSWLHRAPDFAKMDATQRRAAKLRSMADVAREAAALGWVVRPVFVLAPWRRTVMTRRFASYLADSGLMPVAKVCDRELSPHSRRDPVVNAANPNRDGFVYFIADGTGLVKIGWSSDVRRRLRSLQSANGTPLRLLLSAPGTMLTEHRLHEAFADYRVTGEWFRQGPRFVRFLLHLRKKRHREPLDALDLLAAMECFAYSGDDVRCA